MVSRHSAMSPARRREALAGYLFISPWILGFLLFTLLPMVASLGLSFFKWDMLSPAERNPHTHTEAVAQMKRFCTERGAWMDEHIDILRQYSHESKNKKFNH